RWCRVPVEVLVEVIDRDEFAQAETCDVAGMVLKGCEAGGRIGSDSSFLLLQYVAGRTRRPFWVQGGGGLNSSAACLAAGATGVVLDSQVLLARESPLRAAARRRLAAFDGSETVVVGASLGAAYRIDSRSGTPAAEQLRALEERLGHSGES